MSCTEPGCTIHYTLNLQMPTTASPVYTDAVKVTVSGTVVQAIAVAPGKTPSKVTSSAAFHIESSEPVFYANGSTWGDPPAGVEEFVEKTIVHIESSSPTSKVYYTLTGEVPTMTSQLYDPSNPIAIDSIGDTTIRAMEIAPGMSASPVATSDVYEIINRLTKPKIFPASGTTHSGAVQVSIVSGDQGGRVHFTTDGEDPTLQSQVYLAPFEMTTVGDVIIKAMVVKEGLADSRIQTATFRVIEQVKTPTFDLMSGTFTDTVVVHVSCETAGARIRYTVDGKTPNAASAEYVDGITLGVGGDGEQATYMIKAIAMLAPDMGDSHVAETGPIVVRPQVQAPVVSPDAAGPFENSVEVRLTSETPGAVIHYTTDMSEPSAGSAVYDEAKTGPIVLTSTGKVVKAIAFAVRMSPSQVTESVAFVLEASDPTVTPDGGEYVDSVDVTLESATPGAIIHFTVDGTDPDATSPQYQAPLVMSQTDQIVKAIAVHPLLANSKVTASAKFVVKASLPELSPQSGVFTEDAKIVITTATAGAQIHYTLDGSAPTVDSPVCTSPLSITETGSILKAIVAKPGLSPSDVVSMTSPIVVKALPPVLTPDAGTFTNEASVVMSCTEPGCTIHYSLDGVAPTLASPLYTGRLVITSTDTIVLAIAVAAGKSVSDVSASSEFKIVADAASFSANGTAWGQADDNQIENFVEQAVITMTTTTPDGEIIYTTDGSLPTATKGFKYDGPFEDTKDGQEVIHALVLAPTKLPSPVSESKIYDIVMRSPVPQIRPNTGGPFVNQVLIHLADIVDGGSAYMTTDGSDPIPTVSEMYKQPFILRAIGTTIVKAMVSREGKADSNIATASFLILEQVKSPVFDVISGKFTNSVTVHLTCATEGAKIRYTIDGSTPNAASPEYTDGITLGLGEFDKEAIYMLKAIAIKAPNMGDSVVKESGTIVVQPQVSAPVITPGDRGPWVTPLHVQLESSTPEAVLHYTTDGSTPSPSSLVYGGPIMLTSTGVIVKAIGVAEHMAASQISESSEFVLEAAGPVVRPNGGQFVVSVETEITCPTDGAVIHYTVDGSEPTSASPTLDDAIDIRTDLVLKAVAVHPDLADSKMATSEPFVITPDPPKFSPDSGTFVNEAHIHVTSSTAGCEIRCTLDNTDPSAESQVCKSPVTVKTTGTMIKAVATKEGLSVSEISSLTSPLIIKSAPPTLTPDGGSFPEKASFVVSCPLHSDCKMYFTLDGTAPTASSPLYTGAVTILSTGTVVKAISVSAGKAPSDVVTSAPFVIEPFEPSFIVNGTMEDAIPAAGGAEEEEFTGTVKIHLRSRTASGQVHYTTNGDQPTIKSPVYIPGHPIELSAQGEKTTIKALTTAHGMSPSPVVVSDVLDILSRVSTPEIEPHGGGPYSGQVLITMQSFTPESEIVYTIDSSEPTGLSTAYTAPFLLSTIGSTTIKAMGTRDGLADSPIASATFVVLEQVATPVLTPSYGTFVDSLTLHISCATEGAKIRYTTNGDDPNAGSAEYIDGVFLGLGQEGEEAEYTVKAVGIAPNWGNSKVAVSESLVIQPRVLAPVIKPDIAGPWENRIEIQLTTETPGASIRYTDDGSEPTVNSALYDPQAPPVLLFTHSKIKAVAFAPHMAASLVTESVNYEIEVSDPTFTPNGGDFEEFAEVSILCLKSDAVLHYVIVSSTDDFMTATSSSPVYVGPLKLEQTGLTVKAIAVHPDLIESEVNTSLPFIIRVSKPKFSPIRNPLVFVAEAHIHVTSTTAGCEIHCTFDGADPTEMSPVCVSPVTVSTSGTVIKAVATKDGLTVSRIAESEPIIVKALPPVVTPDHGSFINEVSVVMTCAEPGCTIHYVLGAYTTPTLASPVYTEPLTVTTTDTVIRAVAVAEGKAPSDVTSTKALEIQADAATFFANGTQWRQGVQTAEEEDYVEEAEILLETTTPNAVIVYTTDGEFPTQLYGVKYSGPIDDSHFGDETIRAVVFAEGMRPSAFSVSPIYDIIAKLPRPKLLPASEGPFVTKVLVSIDNYLPDTGSVVYMTTDGQPPTLSSELYSEPFEITVPGTTVVKAMMTKAGQADSDVAMRSFTVLERVATPTIDIMSGIFTDNVTVHLSCATQGARIRYTTDGGKPNAASLEYVDGISLELAADGTYAQYTVRAVATLAPEMGDSFVFESGSFLVQPQAQPPVPKPDPELGPYLEEVVVTLLTPTDGGGIVYTDDGTDPLTSPTSKTYDGPFLMMGDVGTYPRNFTIKAVTEHAHMTASEVMTAEYETQRQACTPVFSPGGGIYIAGVNITITCVQGESADVYYSMVDSGNTASAPAASDSGDSILYTEPITLLTPGTFTIAAIAMGEDVISSPAMVSSEYVVEPEPQCAQDEYEPGIAHAANDR